jgi:hypothetical protein
MNRAELTDKMATDAKAAEVRELESFIYSVTTGLKKRNCKVIHQIYTDY